MNALQQQELRFDGATYEPPHDKARLGALLALVKGLMFDQRWRTLAEIQAQTGGTEASVSARLRDLRKPRFGSYVVERRPRGVRVRGLFEYRLLQPDGIERTP